MNRTHRTLWNDVTQAFVAVGEHVRARGKSGSSSTALAPEAPLAQDASGPVGDPGRPAAPRAAGTPWRKALSSAMPRMYALESRLMFDAAAVDAALDAAAQASHTDTHLATLAPAARETLPVAPQAVATPAALVAAADRDATRDTTRDTTLDGAAATRREIVFIDAQVPDWQQLAASVAPEATVVVLQSDRDGLTQMADHLAEHPGIDAIHIVSHGWQGDLWLGNHYLSSATLGADAATLARIGQALGAEGDILLYACETGAGTPGAAFIGQLAALTGADVAASDDRTGAGGDWQLEVTSGAIETGIAFSQTTTAAYDHSLATITVTSSADSGAGTLRNAISSATAGDTITFDSSRTVTLSSGQLTIAQNLTIDGDLDNNGTADVTLDANHTSRVLNITAGTVTLDGLTITNGLVAGSGGNRAAGVGGNGGDALGAGIYNAGTLTLKNSTVTANKASGGGGAGGNTFSGTANGAGGGGGGFGTGLGGVGGTNFGGNLQAGPSAGQGGRGAGYNSGTRYLGGAGGSTIGGAGSNYSGGYADGSAGGTANSGTLSIGGGGGGAGYDAAGGRGGNAAGGIYNAGTMTIIGSTVTHNLGAGGGGGGGAVSGAGTGAGGAGGSGVGGLWSVGTLTMDSTSVVSLSTGNTGGQGTGGTSSASGSGATGSGANDRIGAYSAYVAPDTTAPTVSSVSASTANGTYKAGDTVSIQVNFSESVTVTGTPQLTLETGSIDRVVNYASGSGTSALTFTYTVQAGDTSADLDYLGTTALALNGGTLKDAAGNDATLTLASPGAANSLGANKALVIDGVAPVFSSAATSTTGAKVILTYDSALSATTAATGAFTVTVDGTARSVTAAVVSGSTVELTLGLAVDSGETVTVAYADPSGANDANAVQDSSGNDAASLIATGVTNQAASQYYATFDHIYTANNPNGNTFNTFSEVVSTDGRGIRVYPVNPGLAGYDPAVTFVSNGSSNTVFLVINGTVTQMYLTNGVEKTGGSTTPEDAWVIANNTNLNAATLRYVLSSSGYAINTGGNETINSSINLADLDGLVTFQAAAAATPPTATIVVADATLAAGETSAVTITFSEAVTGFTNADLTVANGTLSAVSSSDGGTTWTATFTPSSSVTDTTNLITLDNTGVMTVSSSTAGSGTTDSNNYAIDTARPTAGIVMADSALAVGETSLVTFTFSEAVTGFSNADLSVANGTLSAVSSANGGITWTATLTPTSSVTDTSNVITLDNTGVTDAAGNAGSGTTDSNNYAIDTTRPTLASSITISDTALKIGDTATVTFTFTEAVTGFTTADVSVPNGTLSGLSSANSGITWTATLTPSSSTTDTSNVITLDYTGITDSAGNAGTSTADSGNYRVDTDRPSLASSIDISDATLKIGETATVTFVFSEAVSGFTVADVLVPNGTLSGLSSGDGGITWTATFTPTSSVTDTSNVITLDNTGVMDTAGNAGSGTTDSGNYAIDTARPTATIVVADSTLTAGETSGVTFTFSEAVSGFTAADLTVANGSLSGLSSTDSGITWTATFTPTSSITDATNLITLDNTGVTDAAGNAGSSTTDSNNYAITTVRPTATIVVADSTLAAGETSGVTITFSEAVTGFSNADLTVANGTLSAVSSMDGGVTWTATFTPTSSITDATNIITLDNTGVTNAAGNAGSGTTDSNNYSIDTAAADITGPSGNAGDGTSTDSVAENTTAVHTFTASESASWAISGGADAALFSINASTGALVFATAPDFETPTDADTNNAYVVQVQATDSAGNVSTQTVTITVTDVADNAPVLADTLLTHTVLEDAGAPVGAVGSLISAYTGGITDGDAGAASGIAITAADTTLGAWYFTTDGGTTWQAVGTVSATSARVLADDANTRLYFQPTADTSGNVSAGLTFKAWDQSDGLANGSSGVDTVGGIGLLATLNTPGNAWDVQLSPDGTRAYVTDYSGGVHIVDINAPLSPVLLGSYTGTSKAMFMTLSADGNTAFVGSQTDGLVVLDVSNAASPTLMGSLSLTGYTYGVALSSDGNTLYAANSGNGLRVIDITNPAAPTVLGTYDTPGDCTFVTLSPDGQTIYAGDYTSGVQVIDVSDPASPTLLATSTGVGLAYDLTLASDGRTAYVTDMSYGLRILDVSNPSSPSLLSSIAITGSAIDVKLSADGTTAYVASLSGGISAVDVSVSAAPILLARYDTTGSAGGVTLSADGRIAYVAGGSSGLQVIDVDLSAPAFSTATDTIALTVTPVNDAPVLTGDLIASLNQGATYTLTPTDLGYTDIDDVDAGVTLHVGSLVNGAVQVSGVNASSFSVADLAAGNVTFVHDGTAATAASFAVTVEDGDEDTSTPTPSTFTFTVDVAAAITGPSGNAGDATATDSVVENTTAVHTFTASETATWAISGGADAALFSINASTGALVFATAPDFEAPTDADTNNAYVVQVQSTDSAGNVSTQTVTITVTDVADNAPVLADTTLTHTVLEDAGAPVGAVGSLISAYTGGITDGDAGAASGIAITAADTTLGAWYFTTDGGTTWQAVGTVSATSARVLANDANTRLYFQPTADTSGNVSAGLTFKAWDQSDGMANGSSGVDTVGGISLLGTLGTAGQAYDVKLSPDGTRAYVSGIGNGLSIIDISDRSAPALLGTYTGAAGALFVTLAADGNTAYIGENGAIQIVDVSDPANPTLLGSLGGSGSFYEIALSADGNTAYVASDFQGLQVVDVSNPASPTLLGVYNTSGQALFVTLSADGQTAYVGDIGGDVQIIDVSTSASPSLLGTVTGIHAHGTTLSADGQTAYVADSSYGLRVIDVSNPASATLVGSLAVPDTPGFDVALSADGNTAYITGSTGNLTLVDVSSPSAPVQLASYNTAGVPIGVALSSDGSVAYVANVYLGLQVIDVNLSAPAAYSTTTDTIALTVTPVNDAPVLTGDLIASLNQGATYTLTTTDLGYTDVDDVDAGVTLHVGSLVNGAVQVSGVNASSFSVTDLAAGNVTFVHDGTAATTASFAVTVEDGDEDSSTPTPSTFTFTVDVAASITGPAGSAGDGVSQVTLLENGTAVHTFVASEAVTWSLSTLYADDAARFSIDPTTGALSFIAAPDYEAPGDTDSNQQYVVRVQATDAAGNVSTQELTVTIVDADEVAPTVTGITSSTANGTYKAGDTLSLQVRFDEAVTVTGTPQLALETGATDRVVDYVSGSGTDTLTFLYTVQAGDTSADLDQLAATALALNGGAIRDAAGNHAVLTLASPGAAGSLGDNQALVIDTTAPAAPSAPDLASASDTGVSDTDNRTRNTTPIFTGTAEAGATVTLYDTDGTTVLGTGTADGSGNWSITTSPLSEGTHTVSAQATDAAGNIGLASTSLLVTVDTVAPTATVVVADAMLTSSETSAVTITFNEAVSGFTADDLLVENGTLSGLTTVDGGTTWTATLTPAAGITDAANLITLDNTGVADLAGNAGNGTVDSNPYAIDTLNPSLATSIMVSDTTLRRGDTATVTFTFTEAISGFTTADVTVSNGTLSGLTTLDGGITWTATLTPTDSVTDATNLITLDYTGVLDTAGNAGSGAATSSNYAIDTATPTATVVVADAALTRGETSAVTFTFSEAVSGFTLADLTVDNGTLSGLTTVDGGTTWTATLAPTAGITDATNLITLNNTGVADLAGNTGSGTTDSNNYAIDTATPVVTGPSGSAGDATATDSVVENTAAVHTFSADQAVTWTLGGTDAARFSLDATTGALRFITAPDFEAPNDADANNTYVVQVQATDAAGNVSTQTLTISVTDADEVAPAIAGPSGSAGASTSLDAVAENTTPVHTFGASEAVTWAISGGADAAVFSLDAATGALRFISAPDYETPLGTGGDGPNQYVVQVQARDAAGNVSTQQVVVTVTDVDERAPSISGPSGSAGDATATDSVVENTTAVHTFSASESVTWAISGGADAARFRIDASTGALRFVTEPDFEAPTDSNRDNAYAVQVQATDAAGNAATQQVTVRVTDANEAPTLSGDLAATVAEGGSVTLSAADLGFVDVDDGAAGVTFRVAALRQGVVQVGGATATAFSGADLAAGRVSFRHDGTEGAAASFSVLVENGNEDSSTPAARTFTLAVTPVNDVPVTAADTATTAEDTPVTIDVLANDRDADGDALTLVSASVDPSEGTVALVNGRVVFTPVANFTGTATVTYVMTDGTAVLPPAQVTVTVTPVNDAPVWLDGSSTDLAAEATMDAGTALSGQAPGARDADGDALVYTLADAPAHGTLVISAEGAWTYTPAASFSGVDRMAVVVTDAQGGVRRLSLAVTVRPLPVVAPEVSPPAPAPVVVADVVEVPSAPQALQATAFDSTLVMRDAAPVITLAPNDATPVPDASRFAMPTARTDGDIYTRSSGFQVMVTPASEPNLRLYRGVDDFVVGAGTPIQIQVPADTFMHTVLQETVTLSAAQANGQPLPGWLSFDGKTGQFVGTPPAGLAGDVAVRIVARDSQGREAVATFRIQLNRSLDRPTSLNGGHRGLTAQLSRGEAWTIQPGQRVWQAQPRPVAAPRG